MKVLVYGAGVIDGQICHALFSCGNDVTVVARGDWAKTLRHDGLRIRHYIQRKDTVDRPRVLESPNDTRYDAAFAAMQYRQMEVILDDLAAIDSPLIVMVGNNLSASEMEARLYEVSKTPKTVLFGFGSTAGHRENGRLVTVHTGDGKLTVGGLRNEAASAAKETMGGAAPDLRRRVMKKRENRLDKSLYY